MNASKWYVYILYSPSKDSYYTGYTADLEKRISRHNAGWSRSTKSGIPWKIVYTESFKMKADAIKREKVIKRKKSRRFIEQLINS